jgi:hypothetical protein
LAGFVGYFYSINSVVMKKTIFCFVMFLCFSRVALSQNDEVIIDSAYKFRYASPGFVKAMPEGTYIFKIDIDYITFMSQYCSEGLFHPVFFNNKEMGLIIRYQSPSMGSRKQVYAVFETASHIVVQIHEVHSNIQFYAVNEQKLCIALKKSQKEIVIQEVQ